MSIEKQGKFKLASSKRWMEKETSNYTASFLKTPPGATIYKIKVGKSKLDVVPYVTGKGNPNAPDEGLLWWERTFFVHRNIGPNQSTVICLARTLEKPCPICEARQRMLKKDETEEADAIKPKEWVIVQLRDRNDKEKGIQLLPLSFHRFVDKVHEMANSGDAEDGFDSFWHPKGGKALRVNWGEDNSGTGKYTRAKTVIFEDRADLPDSLIEKGFCLDELLIAHDYKKLKAMFETGEGESEDEDAEEEESEESETEESEEDEEKPKSKKSKSSAKDEAEDEEESESEDDEEDEEKPKSKKKKSSEEEDESESEDEESEEDEEEEKPKAKKKKQAEEDDESEDEESEEESESEDDEEEEEKPKKKTPKPSSKKNKGEPEEGEEGWGGFDSPENEEEESEDEEESEEEESEEEKPKKKKKK